MIYNQNSLRTTEVDIKPAGHIRETHAMASAVIKLNFDAAYKDGVKHQAAEELRKLRTDGEKKTD